MILNGLVVGLHANHISVAHENGPIENLQLLLAICGAVLFACSAKGQGTGCKVLVTGLALLFLTMAVREAEVRPLEIPWLTAVMKGSGKKIWLGSLWLIAGLWFLRHRLPTWLAFRGWLGSRAGKILIAGAMLLVLGSVFEKSHLLKSEAMTMFVEELCELNGQWLLLISAIWTLKMYRRSAA